MTDQEWRKDGEIALPELDADFYFQAKSRVFYNKEDEKHLEVDLWFFGWKAQKIYISGRFPSNMNPEVALTNAINAFSELYQKRGHFSSIKTEEYYINCKGFDKGYKWSDRPDDATLIKGLVTYQDLWRIVEGCTLPWYFPPHLESACKSPEIKRKVADYLETQEIKDWIALQVKKMADDVVSAVGGRVESGIGIADCIVWILRGNSAGVSDEDVKTLHAAISEYSFDHIRKYGFEPSLDMDYGPSRELRELLEKNNLLHLVRHFPMKGDWRCDLENPPVENLVLLG